MQFSGCLLAFDLSLVISLAKYFPTISVSLATQSPCIKVDRIEILQRLNIRRRQFKVVSAVKYYLV